MAASTSSSRCPSPAPYWTLVQYCALPCRGTITCKTTVWVTGGTGEAIRSLVPRHRGGRGGRLFCRSVQLELFQRRARRLGAETLEQRVAVQDLGRRDGDGVAAWLDAGQVLLHRARRKNGGADPEGDGKARRDAVRAEGRNPDELLRR